MVDSKKPVRPPIDWGWLITLALVVGVAPAIGRDVTTELRESWGRWPAIVAGTAVAGLVALGVLAVAAIVRRFRHPHGDAEPPGGRENQGA